MVTSEPRVATGGDKVSSEGGSIALLAVDNPNHIKESITMLRTQMQSLETKVMSEVIITLITL